MQNFGLSLAKKAEKTQDETERDQLYWRSYSVYQRALERNSDNFGLLVIFFELLQIISLDDPFSIIFQFYSILIFPIFLVDRMGKCIIQTG